MSIVLITLIWKPGKKRSRYSLEKYILYLTSLNWDCLWKKLFTYPGTGTSPGRSNQGPGTS